MALLALDDAPQKPNSGQDLRFAQQFQRRGAYPSAPHPRQCCALPPHVRQHCVPCLKFWPPVKTQPTNLASMTNAPDSKHRHQVQRLFSLVPMKNMNYLCFAVSTKLGINYFFILYKIYVLHKFLTSLGNNLNLDSGFIFVSSKSCFALNL